MVTDRQLFLHHVAQTSGNPMMLEIRNARGIFLYDTRNKPYIDLVSGVSVSHLGHNHPAVIRAVQKQVGKHMHLMVYGEIIQSPQVRYSEWLAENLPSALDNVFFVNSGSEAMEGAMKLAKRVTGRHEIIAFQNAYHGSTQGALSIFGDPSFRQGFLPLLPGIRHIRFNNVSDLDTISGRTAGVVVEPIQAEAGIIEPEEGFLEKLRKKCDETGALLILDEVQTAFGRTGSMFAFEQYRFVPDILCLAKSLGGGMPLGAFISSREIMKHLTYDPPLGHITTFGGHPVSCAAGLAAQTFIKKNNLVRHVVNQGALYRKHLKHPAIQSIRGKGLFLAVVLKQGLPVDRFLDYALEEGLIIDRFLFCDNAFRIAPPLIINDTEVLLSVNKIEKALDRLHG
ncbi:MAG: aspartate aminotransferase family protein [Bacteroidales bacterium]|nr:aspartate aminotransferase family protein [Bacteroidales bacterium]MBN2697577.1 aspartate aminotransferase family protein [Bacteroidales bacterium]